MESITPSSVTIGIVFQFGCHVTPRANAHDRRRFLHAELAVAWQMLNLNHATAIGACRGIINMLALKQYKLGEVLAWCRGGGVDNLVYFLPENKDVSRKPPTQSLALELEEIDKGATCWEVVCFIQCLCAGVAQCKGIVAIAPNITLLVSASARYGRVTAEGPTDDEAPGPPRNKIDIELWLPPKKYDFP